MRNSAAPPSFAALVQSFFAEHLTQQRALSARTVAAYRDAFMLFLEFTQARLHKPPTAMLLTDITPALMHGMVAGGADVIELGVPFSDPMADGPVIQRAAERALLHGIGLPQVLDYVRAFRAGNADTPAAFSGASSSRSGSWPVHSTMLSASTSIGRSCLSPKLMCRPRASMPS